MRFGWVVSVFGLLLVAVVASLSAQTKTGSFVAGTKEDETAIRAIIQSADADQTDPHMAADLDWENAFGIRYFDLKKRDAFYGEIVKPQMKNVTDSSTLEVKIKFIEPTVAVADEYWHLAGQVYAGETKPGPDRWGRTTYVFKKEDGVWTEVLERVADLRIPYFKHYDAIPAPVTVSPEILATYAGSYQKSSGEKVVEVTVKGDRLSIVRKGKTYVGIPTGVPGLKCASG
jgi:hypothetical protein